MTEGTIGQLNEQASVRRFQMDDVTFTFVADGAMSMAPQMLLKTIPPAYWDAHPDRLDRQGRWPCRREACSSSVTTIACSLMPAWG